MKELDFARERERFPSMVDRAFFAMQCMGAFPREMLDDLDEYRQSLVLRNRAIDGWLERLDEMPRLIADLLDVHADDVMLRSDATGAHAAIAASIHPRGERRRIVISTADFHSTRYLWTAQAARGFEIVEVDANGPEHALAETYLPHIDERTAIVALSLVSPRSGAMLDVKPLVEHAHRMGALVVLDAYQAVGVVPIAPRALDVDVLVGGNHKWLGSAGSGIAFAYVAPSFSKTHVPAYPGWIGHSSMIGFDEAYVPAQGARRFQQGTPPMEPIYTARAGLKFVRECGIDALRARSLILTQRLIDAVDRHHLTLRTPREAQARGGMIVLDVPDADAIADALADQRIDVDARRGAGLRIGPHPCVSFDECDRVIAAVANYLGH
ncbi:kynureninase [soil metagenome]